MDPGRIFEEVEFEAYKVTARIGANNKYKAETTVRNAARKVWNHANTNREELGPALEAFATASAREHELKSRFADGAPFDDTFKLEYKLLPARQASRRALVDLIEARGTCAAGQVDRTLNYLEDLLDATDQALQDRASYVDTAANFTQEAVRLAQLRPDSFDQNYEVELLEPYLARCTETLTAFDDFNTRLGAAIAAIRASTENNKDLAAAFLENFRQQKTNSIAGKIERRLIRMQNTLSQSLDNHRASPPASSQTDQDIEAAYVDYLDELLKHLTLYKMQLNACINAYERIATTEAIDAVDDLKKTKRSIKRDKRKVMSDLKLHSTILARLAAHDRVYEPDSEAERRRNNARIQRGELQHGWVPVGKLMKGGNGKVQVWVKQNHDGIIVDRVVIKDGSGTIRDKTPLEVRCMELCGDTPYIVKLLNWRFDMERPTEEGDLKTPFRLYLEYCGHGDLFNLVEKYGFNFYDDQPRLNWIPRPFIWFVLKSLAEAAQLMENGGDPKQDWKVIVHGDLKLENVFIGENTTGKFESYPLAKLGDFGLAQEDEYHDIVFSAEDFERRKERPYGTPYCRAPEQRKYKPGFGIRTQPDSKTDVWGIGCVIWCLMKLLNGLDRINDWQDLAKGEERVPSDFTKEEREFYGKNLCDLIMECLRFRPKTRPTVENILERVQRYTSTLLDGKKNVHDEVYGTESAPKNDAKWNDYFLKVRYDNWARGNVLADYLDERDKRKISKDALMPPRKRQRTEDDSEDYGGPRGTDLKGIDYANGQEESEEETLVADTSEETSEEESEKAESSGDDEESDGGGREEDNDEDEEDEGDGDEDEEEDDEEDDDDDEEGDWY